MLLESWLSAAFDYRKEEFRTDLIYLQAEMKRKIRESKIWGTCSVEVRTVCLFQPVKKIKLRNTLSSKGCVR